MSSSELKLSSYSLAKALEESSEDSLSTTSYFNVDSINKLLKSIFDLASFFLIRRIFF